MTITATEFKAKCLELLDRVGNTGEVLQVTKRGKVVAEVVPPRKSKKKFFGPGIAKGEMVVVGDILEPLETKWESAE